MESMLLDLRYGLRTLRSNPGFAAVAIRCLGSHPKVNYHSSETSTFQWS